MFYLKSMAYFSACYLNILKGNEKMMLMNH